jgi:hypothetical protein
VWVTKYTVNGGALQEGRTIVIAPPLTGSAVHEIRFYSLDNVGNQEAEKLVSITVLPRVDNTAPTTTSNGVASYTGTATINLTATDNVGGQGVSHTHYTINDGPIQTGPIVVVPGPGTGSDINHIDFWSEDFAGNEEAHKAFSFTSNAVATGNATLSFVWGGGAAQAPGSWTRLHVENSAGATIASYYGQKDLGQNLTWNVTVPAGQFYTMVVDSWYDGDSEENWSGRNAVRAPESGVMATGSTTPLSY